MKTIYTIIIFLFFCNFLLAQGEIIDRETKKVNDYNLKIFDVKNDSITYKAFGRIKKIPSFSVIAYRVDSRKDVYVFPNPKDKTTYYVKNGRAVLIIKVAEFTDQTLYENNVLKKYKIEYDSFQTNTLNHVITLHSILSSKSVTYNPKRELYIILKKDSNQIHMIGNIFKITNDSIIYFACKINKGTSYYAIDKNDIKYLGFESQKSYIIRMVGGGLSCLLIPSIAFIAVPIYIFKHPDVRKYDIENTWRLTLLKNNINQKNNSKSGSNDTKSNADS